MFYSILTQKLSIKSL